MTLARMVMAPTAMSPDIAEQAGVKADVQDALGKLHDKGSDAQGDAGKDDRAPQTGVPELQPQCGCFPGEEAENPGAGNPLGENGGQGGALARPFPGRR